MVDGRPLNLKPWLRYKETFNLFRHLASIRDKNYTIRILFINVLFGRRSTTNIFKTVGKNVLQISSRLKPMLSVG